MFDRVLIYDWSARSKPSPVKPVRDAIYSCFADQFGVKTPIYHRTRFDAFKHCLDQICSGLDAGGAMFVGFDFSFGYPAGFAKAVTGSDLAVDVWDYLNDRINDAPNNENNRFEIANDLNALFPGIGPFWGCPASIRFDNLPYRGTERSGHGMPDLRKTEEHTPSAQSNWKLFTTGSVGSQSLLGVIYLARLRQKFGRAVHMWPFDGPVPTGFCGAVVCEVYPSLAKVPSDNDMASQQNNPIFAIPDACQVTRLAMRLITVTEIEWQNCHPDVDINNDQIRQEGWIFGVPTVDGPPIFPK